MWSLPHQSLFHAPGDSVHRIDVPYVVYDGGRGERSYNIVITFPNSADLAKRGDSNCVGGEG